MKLSSEYQMNWKQILYPQHSQKWKDTRLARIRPSYNGLFWRFIRMTKSMTGSRSETAFWGSTSRTATSTTHNWRRCRLTRWLLLWFVSMRIITRFIYVRSFSLFLSLSLSLSISNHLEVVFEAAFGLWRPPSWKMSYLLWLLNLYQLWIINEEWCQNLNKWE